MKKTPRGSLPLLGLSVTLLLLLPHAAAADPVVTQSYLTQTYQPYIRSQADSMAKAAFDGILQKARDSATGDGARAALYAAAWVRQSGGDRLLTLARGSYRLTRGSVVTGGPGTQIILTQGGAQVLCESGYTLVDVTNGTELYAGGALATQTGYMIADAAGIGVKITSAEAVVQVSGPCRLLGAAAVYTGPNTPGTGSPGTSGPYTAAYTKYAQALQEMNLFRGTNTGYELERSATRVEALVMLVRLLGEETDALASTAKHPFKDVPAWADRYVAYAYQKGYTNGVSAKSYGAEDAVTREQYLTFLLRALGYSDAAGEFVWSESPTKAAGVGMLSQAELNLLQPLFYRDQMVFVSYKALNTARKGASDNLLNHLIDKGAVSLDAAYRATIIVS